MRLLDATESANGFANRFLWVCVRRSKCLPEGGNIHTVDFSEMVRKLTEAVEYGREDRLIRLDNDARQVWHAVYAELSAGRTGLLGAVTTRAEAQVMRLAMIYALLDQSPWIRVEHLRAALDGGDEAGAAGKSRCRAPRPRAFTHPRSRSARGRRSGTAQVSAGV